MSLKSSQYPVLRFSSSSLQPLFNCGVSFARLGDRPNALDYLIQARKVKVERKHEIVSQAIDSVDVSSLEFPFVTV